MKIIGFLQVRNEIVSGHLSRFIERNLELFDKLYVYDDASDDGTPDRLEAHATFVLRAADQNFSNELHNKAQLLEKVKAECDEGDAILWLDTDEVLYASKTELQTLIRESFWLGFDSISLPHRNLWRSTGWFRVDDNYNNLRPARIWKLSSSLSFPLRSGLHITNEPTGLTATRKVDIFPVVHFGFASTDLIVKKYEGYRRHWLDGYALNRMTNEKDLRLEPLSGKPEHMGSRFSSLHEKGPQEPRPERLPPLQWSMLTRRLQLDGERETPQADVTLVSLIYKDIEWLEFQYSQMLKLQTDMPMGKVKILFIANDATEEVLDFLKDNLIPHKAVTTRRDEKEWFINSVYRAYNKGVEFAQTEYVYLVNSDMAYTRGTLSKVYERRDPKVLLASRLVELGVLESGKHGIERSFGSSPRSFRERDFSRFARSILEAKTVDGGLYMPLLVHRKTFLELGGFPEGNITRESLGEYLNGSAPVIAELGELLIPGDQAFVLRAQRSQVIHKTVFDSIAYHFQAGERRSKSKKQKKKSGFAIINDSIIGINGEKVLWGYLAERLESMGAKVSLVSSKLAYGRLNSLFSPVRLWFKTLKAYRRSGAPRVAFSNATYALSSPGRSRKVVFRQDYPGDMLNRWIQRFNIFHSDAVYANDPEFVESKHRRNSKWIPVPLAEMWWTQAPKPAHASLLRKVIFVGSFSDTKGWPILSELVRKRGDVEWTLVSKYRDDQHGLGSPTGNNWTVFRTLPQAKLKELVAASDLLIVASPYETQCLAALEALSQDTPVLTTQTGFLGGFPLGVHEFGVVSDNLSRDFDLALASLGTFRPREFLKSLDLIGERSWGNWDSSLRSELEWSFRDLGKPSAVESFVGRAVSFGQAKIRFIYRRKLKPALLVAYRRIISN